MGALDEMVEQGIKQAAKAVEEEERATLAKLDETRGEKP